MASTSTSASSVAAKYTAPAMLLHWLLALLIIGTFVLGAYMADLPFSPQRLKFYSWHKWAGVVILGLSLMRLLYRRAKRPPADLPMPAWQRIAAHATHHLLYVLFFAVPLAGWAYSSAAGFPIVLFGVLPLPDFVSPDKALAEAIKPWHETLAWTMALLVLMHIGAAFKHHFIDRDGLLKRMLPGRG